MPDYWLGIGLLFLSVTGFAQPPTRIDTTVYVITERQPQFPGGIDTLKTYMQNHVQYPAEARKARIKDRVYVSFVVELDGRLTHVQLLKGIGYGCDAEALRVVSAMPRWKPGSQSGKPLRVKYNLPVLFGIDYPATTVR